MRDEKNCKPLAVLSVLPVLTACLYMRKKKKHKMCLFFSCDSKSVDSLNESSGKNRIVVIVLKTKTLVSLDFRSSLDYVCNLGRQLQPSQHKLAFLGGNLIALLRNSLSFFFYLSPPKFIYLFSPGNIASGLI